MTFCVTCVVVIMRVTQVLKFGLGKAFAHSLGSQASVGIMSMFSACWYARGVSNQNKQVIYWGASGQHKTNKKKQHIEQK